MPTADERIPATKHGAQNHRAAQDAQRIAAHVESKQRRHPDEAQAQPDQAPAARALAGVEPHRQQHDEQRIGGDQQRGQRRRDVLLAIGDEQKRDDDAHRGDGQQRAPLTSCRP